MICDKRILAVVPARGGSKGIPNKNIIDLCGAPLIQYTIQAGIGSKYIDKLIVSTDSEEIKSISESVSPDVKVPFLRPKELSDDRALSVDVVSHAIDYERRNGEEYEIVVMLQPTSPLRESSDIDTCIEHLIQTQAQSVVSVKDVGGDHPARMYRILSDRLSPVMDEGVYMMPRQDLEKVFIRNGAVYATWVSTISEYGNLIGEECAPVVMDSERSVNIDTYADLFLAKYYMEKK